MTGTKSSDDDDDNETRFIKLTLVKGKTSDLVLLSVISSGRRVLSGAFCEDSNA